MHLLGHRAVAALVMAGLVATACSAGDEATEGPRLSAPASGEALSPLAPGDPIATVELAVLSLDDAGTVNLGEVDGPTVINFWATWCAFCVDEMPDFEAVHQDLGEQVRFLGIAREDDAARALTFAQDIGISYELLEDPDGAFFRASKGRGMPTTLFIDEFGTIRYRHAGPMSAEQLRGFITEYLAV